MHLVILLTPFEAFLKHLKNKAKSKYRNALNSYSKGLKKAL